MVISDAVEGDYSAAGKDIFEKLNKEKNVRVFSYLIGRVKNPDDRAMKEMSCNNRGYFYKIETLGNVWDTVLKYLEILSRPMAEAVEKQKLQYSPVYLDSSGQDMVMTISLGVFNKKNISGVVGVDMLMQTLKQQVPRYHLGSFSHEILINNNGFILIHPRFRDQTGYLPEPKNVYLEDLDRSVNEKNSLNLARMMMDRITDQLRFPVYWLYNNNKRIVELNFTYSFSPIKYSVFSSAIAISDIDSTYYELKTSESIESWLKDGLEALFVIESLKSKTDNYTEKNFTYVRIAPWAYCKELKSKMEKYTPRSLKVYPTVIELYEYLQKIGNKALEKCDANLLKNLLITASTVHKGVTRVWDKLDPELVPHYKGVYTMTSGGYLRYFTYSKTSIPYDRDVHSNSVYKDALAMPWYEIIVSTHTGDKKYVDVSAPSWIESEGKRVLGAVNGVNMDVMHLKKMLLNATKFIGLDCSSSESMSIVCAIVDQNGYIVVSNQGDRYVGRFLGEIQGYLVEHLVNMSIFRKIILKDTQAECPEPKLYNSAASIFFTPAKLVFSFLKILLNSLCFLIYHTCIMCMAFFTQHTEVSSQIFNTMNVSCTKNMPFYIFQDHEWMEHVKIGASRKVRCDKSKFLEYVIAKISLTNLIFLVALQPDDHSCRQLRVTLEHTPIQKHENENDIQFCTQEEHYRVIPDDCFNAPTEGEDQSEYCGNTYLTKPSIILFILTVTSHFL